MAALGLFFSKLEEERNREGCHLSRFSKRGIGRRSGEKGGERGGTQDIFISIRFFLVISRNASPSRPRNCPTSATAVQQQQQQAASEPIIIEKESLDDLNHANRSPCLRAGQSRRPISNNGFHRHRTKLGNTYWHAEPPPSSSSSSSSSRLEETTARRFSFVESTLNRKLKEAPVADCPSVKTLANLSFSERENSNYSGWAAEGRGKLRVRSRWFSSSHARLPRHEFSLLSALSLSLSFSTTQHTFKQRGKSSPHCGGCGEKLSSKNADVDGVGRTKVVRRPP